MATKKPADAENADPKKTEEVAVNTSMTQPAAKKAASPKKESLVQDETADSTKTAGKKTKPGNPGSEDASAAIEQQAKTDKKQTTARATTKAASSNAGKKALEGGASMTLDVHAFDATKSGSITLNAEVFGLPARVDILARVVEWQRAKARAGTHKTKGVSDISGTTAKPFKQKGTGRARQGSLRSPQFRGGATIFGPVVRSHETSLPKKVRKLGLKTALSVKLAEGKLYVVNEAVIKDGKTKALSDTLVKFGSSTMLIIDAVAHDSVRKASSNLHTVNVLPEMGANVLDILRHDTLVLTTSAIEKLEARLA